MKLHEVVAVRKGVKSRTYAQMTKRFKEVQKAALFQGLKREFSPLDDDGEVYRIRDGEPRLLHSSTPSTSQQAWPTCAGQRAFPLGG